MKIDVVLPDVIVFIFMFVFVIKCNVDVVVNVARKFGEPPLDVIR